MKEEEAEKTYKDIIKFCRESRTSYIDPSFPPNDNSIGEIVADGANGKLDVPIGVVNLYWSRPHEIEDSDDDDDFEWSIMNNPKSSDVDQSSVIGNCSLISAISVIAERPDILDNIFPSKEISEEGVYRVKLYINGEWKTILVDDYFPCYMHSGKMATAIGKRKQLWVPLIEKAVAKAYGSYSVLAEGYNSTVHFSTLTGANCFLHLIPKNPNEIDFFWNILTSSISAGFLLCCSSEEEKTMLNEKGIAQLHVYSILAVNDDNHRLLKLRNPWGKFEWKGKWSNEWDGWPASMRDQLLIDSGTFWIELDDFMQMFWNVEICKIRKNWYTFREELLIGLDTPTIKLTVTETCQASFSAIFKVCKSMNHVQITTLLSIHRMSQNNLIGEMIGRSTPYNSYTTNIDDIILTPGQYIIMIFDLTNLNTKPIPRIVICYSSKPIFHELVLQTPKMCNHALRQIVMKDAKISYEIEEVGFVIRNFSAKSNAWIFMVDNFQNNQYFHYMLDFSESVNLRSSRCSLITTDVIPPRSYQIVAILNAINEKSPFIMRKKGKYQVFCVKKCIGAELIDDQSIISQNLQHYPIIDPLDPIHYPQSIFYDSVPIEVSTERKCQKRIKHFLRKCECRT